MAGGLGSEDAALVVATRRGPGVARLRNVAASVGLRSCRVLRSRGRRAGAREGLVAELLEAGVGVVVVPTLRVLHPSPAEALSMVSALAALGIRVVSVEQAWVTSAPANVLAAIAVFLADEERRRASRHGRRVVAVMRRDGARVGRPRKALPVQPAEALRLVNERGWRAAGRAIGLSPASVRRALQREGLLEVPQSKRRTA